MENTIEFSRRPSGDCFGRVSGRVAVFGAVANAAIVPTAVVLSLLI